MEHAVCHLQKYTERSVLLCTLLLNDPITFVSDI